MIQSRGYSIIEVDNNYYGASTARMQEQTQSQGINLVKYNEEGIDIDVFYFEQEDTWYFLNLSNTMIFDNGKIIASANANNHGMIWSFDIDSQEVERIHFYNPVDSEKLIFPVDFIQLNDTLIVCSTFHTPDGKNDSSVHIFNGSKIDTLIFGKKMY